MEAAAGERCGRVARGLSAGSEAIACGSAAGGEGETEEESMVLLEGAPVAGEWAAGAGGGAARSEAAREATVVEVVDVLLGGGVGAGLGTPAAAA